MLKKTLFFVLAAVFFTACNQGGKFTVSGNVSNADGKVLYFEKTGLVKDSLIDSVKLDTKGAFKFKSEKPAYPDLYRLTLDGKQLIIAVDSTEKIQIQGNSDDLISSEIKGSLESEKIQKLRKTVIALQQEFDNISLEKDGAKSKIRMDSFLLHVENHKNIVKGMILSNPRSMASYFALYQQISGNYLFTPFEKEDLPYYQAVATTFNAFSPEYERTKNLYNLVLGAIREHRMTRQQSPAKSLMDAKTVGFLDLELKDNYGYPKKISSLMGQVIVLDFSVYGAETKTDYVFELRDLYNKYNAKGVQIYQVSLDQDKLFWQQSVSNLPWICVNDDTGKSAQMYNVQQVPTLFIIDKQGNIVGRYRSVNQLETSLSKAL